MEVNQNKGSLVLSLAPDQNLFDGPKESSKLAEFVGAIVRKYQNKTDRELKSAVYFTSPMRGLLRREKYEGANLFNAPIDFSIAQNMRPLKARL